ncbi:DNA-binding response regulator, OmpR family, contains REC and winged-helix (wHTH) domain [Ruminococcus sp. YE71]|uniref:response regulator transcription factor n=1 Tax=unclassified Ruminococcus TaxID=2608920 RepID=UPI00088595AF|nr:MULTISPECIES: response regulator transcription factor [unclassified Ruminococcus]SDA25126.1 DNA-binding response regulator, OmpR family, contains REC and winged-helix (wHTH) domain [Ruminococcus sp. YE78]SFW42984.1 DNA-binding response regulator, OmpR family, contains REC and winged-helix (wHTH) domain [Ruminococcus sp. YE71]
MRLLLAEDEKELSNALAAVLKHNNYSVDTVYNGKEAVDYALAGNYDGIIMDIMMPVMDGLEALRELRKRGVSLPVLLLTAKSELEDKVTGLDAGADDYLTKPFAMSELLARVRAMTRRMAQDAAPSNEISFGDLTLNRTTFEIAGPKGRVRLGNKEFQMMEYLISNPHQLISTERFMEKVWGYDSETEINAVWVHISYLRRRLNSAGSKVTIKASRGSGYSLEYDA